METVCEVLSMSKERFNQFLEDLTPSPDLNIGLTTLLSRIPRDAKVILTSYKYYDGFEMIIGLMRSSGSDITNILLHYYLDSEDDVQIQLSCDYELTDRYIIIDQSNSKW